MRSMTAYGFARSETQAAVLEIDIRGVNNRNLDINLRIPENLRFTEPHLRELVSSTVIRGKVELRINYSTSASHTCKDLDPAKLTAIAQQLQLARSYIPDLQAPTFSDLLEPGSTRPTLEQDVWLPICMQVCQQALEQFDAARVREASRLGQNMLGLNKAIKTICQSLAKQMPLLLVQQQERLQQRLTEALTAINPAGYANISGPELSARITQEVSLFGQRVDIAEELTRLDSHTTELAEIFSAPEVAKKQAFGKRIDFLCQEMLREANTLGSKAGSLEITNAAIDLKLLIEQIREQAQNIE